uniref:cation-independent mannose-6-phosphate receptor isoform X2 n=1 Tax=Vespula vulgaris TaxID=7454 RepID=UPI00223B3D44|nr:cation-independent mannose-6-phosphate receptor isoform X2 [Vespula vulgaris]
MYKLNVFIVLCSFSIISLVTVPVKTKSYCEFNEEIFSYFYNLTKLSKPGEDIEIQQSANESIRMQLCSPLIKKCNGKDGYSICLKKNNKEIGIGKVVPQLITKFGKIKFIFYGDECRSGINYKVDILMLCDYSITSYSVPTVHKQGSECHFQMIWSSAFACCANKKEINCTVTNPSDDSHYDLSPLKGYSENYIIYAGTNTSLEIILNVCHSVIFGFGALCQANSGACLYDPVKAPTLGYLNLGDVQETLSFDSSNNLILKYENGAICKENQEKGQQEEHIRTTITFICNLKAKDTLPEVTETDGCHYQLTWITAVACSLEQLHEYSVKTSRRCIIDNPITNFMYNLDSLMDKDFNVTSSRGTKYKFSVCGPLINNTCKAGTGVCLEENGTSLGMANTNLMWQEGGPYLNYTDGNKCNDNQYSQTFIAFFCGPEGSSNDPIIIEENPCQLIIHWNLNLVCEKRIKCNIPDTEVTLDSLISSTNNYIVQINRTVFYINVCRTIIPTPGLNCTHGSGICKASLNANNELVEEVNLGFPKETLIIYNNQLMLRYIEGSVCPEKTDVKISSVLIFFCNNINEHLPKFIKYSKCTYVFEWRTSVVCGTILGHWIPPCGIKDQFFLYQIDLSSLYKNQPIHYVQSANRNYSINICGEQKNGNGSSIAVCEDCNIYGPLSYIIFDFYQNIIKFKYLNGSKCLNSSYMAEITFICDETSETEPTLTWESDCITTFDWHTNITCLNQTNVGTRFSFDVGRNIRKTPTRTSWYCVKPNKRRYFLHSCFNFFKSRRNGRVQYHRIGTNEQARLLLDANNDPTQCQSDSDDDLLDA